MLALRSAPHIACNRQAFGQDAQSAARSTPLRNTACKAADNHIRPIAAAAAASQPMDGVDWNAYDGTFTAHAETARWSLESADFWISDVDEVVPSPMNQDQEHSGFMHIWSSADFVVDAETSRNSLDSTDSFIQ